MSFDVSLLRRYIQYFIFLHSSVEEYVLLPNSNLKEVAYSCVDPEYPVTIVKDEEKKDYRLLHGYFRSPFMDYLPHLLPAESEKAQFQVVLPKDRKPGFMPIVVHYAGTGDHNFNRRRKRKLIRN